MTRHKKILLWASGLLALSLLVLTGCPNSAVVCPNFLLPCGQGCVDIRHDKANCGACGVSCASDQICTAPDGGGGACVCENGSTLCGGACVVTSSDAANCGGCAGSGGVICASNQVCNHGACVTPSTLGGCDGGCSDAGI